MKKELAVWQAPELSCPVVLWGQPFCFQHNQEGLSKLLSVISNVQIKTAQVPTVILESTGHYHQAVIQFLEEHGILFLVVW